MKKVSTVAAKASRKFSQQKLTIGLDLGDRSSWYCVLFFSSRRRHTRSVSAFLLNRSSDLYSMPIAVRYTQDAFSRSGWLWPVDAKGEPLKATSYMAVGFYVAKYVNKKSDMDLAAKGLGAKEWNNS